MSYSDGYVVLVFQQLRRLRSSTGIYRDDMCMNGRLYVGLDLSACEHACAAVLAVYLRCLPCSLCLFDRLLDTSAVR